jgi:hypothetical protein
MKRSFRYAVVLVFALMGPMGCTPEASNKVGEMGKGVADAAKGAAGDMKDAAKSAAGEMASGMSDMMGKATEALSSIEGGADMLKSIKESFSKITETFKGVKDEASASAALPQISKLTESFGGMSDMFGKLPDSAKGAVSGVFSSTLGELKPLVEKIMAIPGVESIIKPAVDALMAKLSTFKA